MLHRLTFQLRCSRPFVVAPSIVSSESETIRFDQYSSESVRDDSSVAEILKLRSDSTVDGGHVPTGLYDCGGGCVLSSKKSSVTGGLHIPFCKVPLC